MILIFIECYYIFLSCINLHILKLCLLLEPLLLETIFLQIFFDIICLWNSNKQVLLLIDYQSIKTPILKWKLLHFTMLLCVQKKNVIVCKHYEHFYSMSYRALIDFEWDDYLGLRKHVSRDGLSNGIENHILRVKILL